MKPIPAKIITLTAAKEAAAPMLSRKTKYSLLAEMVKGLKPGRDEAVEAPLPEAARCCTGRDSRRLVARVTAALQARGIRAPKGYAYAKRVSTTGKIMVWLIKWGA